MANPYAGEVAIVIDGKRHVMRLTLGALAELEDTLGEGSLVALAQRFEGGDHKARDVFALIVAGLRGGGWNGQECDLFTSEIEGGLITAAQAAARLLVRAFTLPEQNVGL